MNNQKAKRLGIVTGLGLAIAVGILFILGHQQLSIVVIAIIALVCLVPILVNYFTTIIKRRD